MLFSGLKLAFLELTSKEGLRGIGYKAFMSLHNLLGWATLISAGYHSMYYIFSYLKILHSIDFTLTLTGLASLLGLIYIIVSGRDLLSKQGRQKFSFRMHIVFLIITILLLLIHLNTK